MHRYLLLLLTFAFSSSVFGQDTLFTKDGREIAVRVLEIGRSEIQYKKWELQDGPDYTIENSLLDSLILSNGERVVPEIVIAQEDPDDALPFEPPVLRDLYPACFGVKVGGPSFLGVEYDNFLSSRTNLSAGIGISGVNIGFTYHFLGDIPGIRWTPYIGLSGFYFTEPDFDFGFQDYGVYVPFGAGFLSDRGTTFRIEAGLFTLIESREYIPFGGIKYGFRI